MKKKLKQITILDLLADYQVTDPTSQDPFFFTFPVTDSGFIAIAPRDAVDYMIHRYGDFSYTYFDYQSKTPLEVFLEDWNRYKLHNNENFLRIAKAYSMDYNPLHNYDKTETHDFSRTYSNTTLSSGHNNTDTTEKGSVSTTQTFNDYKIQNDANTYDGQLANTSSQNTTGSITNIVAPSEDHKTSNNTDYNDTTSVTGNEDTTVDELKVTGNIGVMTSQDMLTAELALRKFNMLEHIIDSFAHEHFVILADGDDENDCCFL